MPTKTEIGENQKYLKKLIDTARCAEGKLKDLQAKIDADKSPAILYSQMKTRLLISGMTKVIRDMNAIVGSLAAVEQDITELQGSVGDQLLIGDVRKPRAPGAKKKPGPKAGAKKKPGPKSAKDLVAGARKRGRKKTARVV